MSEKRGCLMLYFEFEWWNTIIKKLVDKKDIYEKEGYELEPHITIMYGFETDKLDPTKAEDLNRLKNICPSISSLNDIRITKMDIFENEKEGFDVVKFSIESPKLHKLNKNILDNFDIKNDYPDYIPYMTIAYVKSGEGKKYIKKVNPIKSITPSHYVYQDGNRKIKFNFGGVLEDNTEKY